MYSTSLAPIMSELNSFKKIGLAYIITDQAYAVSVNEFDNLPHWRNKIFFYMGAGVALFAVWQVSVVIGLFFGDIAPKSLSLEFAVPLAFMSIVIPSLKNKTLIIVAISSSIFSVLFYALPFKLGLIVSALCALLVGIIVDKPVEKTRG
jgi:predicted branched-subunit amino acid permease